MSENTVSVPTWCMPLLISALGVALAYGSSMAEAEATKAQVKRVEAAVVDVIKVSNANGKAVALNAQAIQQIAKGLANQQEVAKASDEKLARLITIMLEKK